MRYAVITETKTLEDTLEKLEIRESHPSDLTAIETLYPDAFPDEDLLPVVRDLLQETPPDLSLVATEGTTLVGHIIFTACRLEDDTEASMLAPLAVATARHKQGIGTAIVRAGLRRLEEDGVHYVYVLGDPKYYGRFGFATERNIQPPYPMPEEWQSAWQSLTLGDADPPPPGMLVVPPVWRQPVLWGP